MIRLFAALPIPADVAEVLAGRQQGLARARWRTAETLHVTLAFFGEVDRIVAAEIDAGLNGLSAPPLEIRLEGVGAFGEGQHIHAVWAGVARDPALEALAGKCQAVGRRAGVKMEARSWRPHVTLAYLKRPDPTKVAAWIQAHNLLKSPPIRVTWFGLWSSWSSTEGSRYDLEREYPLLG